MLNDFIHNKLSLFGNKIFDMMSVCMNLLLLYFIAPIVYIFLVQVCVQYSNVCGETCSYLWCTQKKHALLVVKNSVPVIDVVLIVVDVLFVLYFSKVFSRTYFKIIVAVMVLTIIGVVFWLLLALV